MNGYLYAGFSDFVSMLYFDLYRISSRHLAQVYIIHKRSPSTNMVTVCALAPCQIVLWCAHTPSYVDLRVCVSYSIKQEVYSTKINTSTTSDLHEFRKNTNSIILQIYDESDVFWETPTKAISDYWHGGHPKRKSMHSNAGYPIRLYVIWITNNPKTMISCKRDTTFVC